MKEVKIVMPEAVKSIISKLNEGGFEAYAVGGCIRDVILGREPNDWDITTSALPSDVKDIFTRTIDTGLKHGTVTVLKNHVPYEITTYRIDGEYEDNRRPKTVEFTRDLVKDLERRDFTINAMAYNEEDGLVDPFNGMEDIQNQVIRCVGNPNHRFNEDALRMLRAIRFSAQLAFKIDIATRKSIKYNAHLIKNVSAERIHVELDKIICSNNPGEMRQLVKYNLIERIIPEFKDIIGLDQENPYHIYTVDDHTYKTLEYLPNNSVLRWTMYFHDIGKGITKTVDEKGIGHFYGHPEKSVKLTKGILERLRFDNQSKNKILKLIEFHDYRFEPSSKSVRRAMSKIGEELFPQYIAVRKADISGQNPVYLEENIDAMNRIEEKYYEVLRGNHCTKIKDLALSGKDLLELGMKGKQIGDTLAILLEYVIECPENNRKETLKEKVIELNK